MSEKIIPCPSCGEELYDSIRKYHLDVPCENDPCHDFSGGHWSKGSYCPYCDAAVGAVKEDDLKEERLVLFGAG